MARYRCGNCSYSFVPKIKDKVPTMCPYCSATGKLFSESSILADLDKKQDFDDDEFS